MDNFQELPRHEALLALYQLKNQLTFQDLELLERWPVWSEGFCDECHATAPLRHTPSLALCDRCALARVMIGRRINEERQRQEEGR